ncbi:MAG TPA: 16S rRNA (guanine(527)-N(7))-methyltransferase RsmG [Candidatus Baltobacteraceae bacterium]|nr:16S rRNA (guanine(527)-N(7))-methyltransferase RsmG [Candidatus Baltobacteraceae bacterium]
MSLEPALLESGVDPAYAPGIAHFGSLLLEANRRFNLTGAETEMELLPHLLDALTLVPYITESLLDIGSGGGLPAIPLAIATGVPATLIESNAKKAGFLRSVGEELGLPLAVLPNRAETAARDETLRDRFACATARAVSTAPTVLELTAPFLRIGGVALLQRGRLEERERNAVADAAPMLAAVLENEVALEGDRRILIVRKTGTTPHRFPRRNGIPEKRPLCF